MEIILDPGCTEQNYWRSLWRDRERFYLLAWRDILVRDKQTVIGIAWIVIRPFRTIWCTISFAKVEPMVASTKVER